MGATVAIVGGRGKSGRAVAAAVTAAGAEVRLLGRAEMPDLAAHVARCDAVYVIAPNMHPAEPQYVGEVLHAVKRAGVPRVVYHSVCAPYEPALPHHLGKAEAEVVVRRSGLAWTILQPGVYLQNYLPALLGPAGSDPGPTLRVPYDPAQTFSFVDLNDVGEVAATVLGAGAEFDGATFELGGPQALSITALAQDASRALGARVTVEQISTAAWSASSGQDLPEREREWLIAMFDYYDAHGLATGSVATRAILGREPADVGTVIARERSN